MQITAERDPFAENDSTLKNNNNKKKDGWMHRLFWIGWQAGKWFHSAAYNYTGALVFLDQLHTKKEEEEEKSKNLQTLYLEVCHLKQNIHISFNYFQGESPEIVALKTTEEQNVETFFSSPFSTMWQLTIIHGNVI